MLIDFVFKNVLSYRNKSMLSMECGARLRRLKKENTFTFKNENLLKSAFIFGPNAGGKSNVIKAIKTLQNVILFPSNNSTSHLYTCPYGNSEDPTFFQIRFMADQCVLDYILEYDQNKVLNECLHINGEMFFERSNDVIAVKSKELEMYIPSLRENQLLLYLAQDKNIKEAITAFSWFTNIVDLGDFLKSEKFLNKDEARLLSMDSFKERFLTILRAADFNIQDYILVDNVGIQNFLCDKVLAQENLPEDIKNIIYKNLMNDGVKQLILEHRSENGKFNLKLENESIGTKKFIQILLNVLPEMTKNKVILIDEFDQSFHLNLVSVLIRVMNEWNLNNQFILTTHQFDVMDFGLRVDQIYFADKNQYGESELFSLFEFDDPAQKRSDFDYKKRYLNGLYGGTHIINEGLLESVFEKEN